MFFLLVFGVLIISCIALSPVGGLLSSLALNEVFPPAITSATEALGDGTVAILGVLFFGFDLALCGAGGLAGYHASRLFRHSLFSSEQGQAPA